MEKNPHKELTPEEYQGSHRGSHWSLSSINHGIHWPMSSDEMRRFGGYLRAVEELEAAGFRVQVVWNRVEGWSARAVRTTTEAGFAEHVVVIGSGSSPDRAAWDAAWKADCQGYLWRGESA